MEGLEALQEKGFGENNDQTTGALQRHGKWTATAEATRPPSLIVLLHGPGSTPTTKDAPPET